MRKARFATTHLWLKKEHAAKLLRDNPVLDRLIEVGTKALRRELMSGETLRAPRQQLRRLRPSAFDLSAKFPTIARQSGARFVLGPIPDSFAKPAIQIIRKSVQLIRKNSSTLCCLEDRGYSCFAFYFCRESLVA
jgi:hypothetical protein